MAQSGYDMYDLLREAQVQWLNPAEVLFILQNHGKFQLMQEPPQKPTSGTLFLFNKRVLPLFRKDGHSWKKKDGRTVHEAHERLKVGNVETLNCYYAHGEQNPCFQRRIYSMLDPAYDHIVLVHYREINEAKPSSASTVHSPVSLSAFSPSPNSYGSQNPGSNLLASSVYEPYQTLSSSASAVVSSDTVIKKNGVYNTVGYVSPADLQLSQDFNRLEEQICLDEDSFKEMSPFCYLDADIDDPKFLEYETITEQDPQADVLYKSDDIFQDRLYSRASRVENHSDSFLLLPDRDEQEKIVDDVVRTSILGPKMSQVVFEVGSSGPIKPPIKKEYSNWEAKEILLIDDKTKLAKLPNSPDCPSFIAWYLDSNYELAAIPPSFFHRILLLQELDLSNTNIKSLPKSLPKLVALKKLSLRQCKLLMELSPQIGKLENLEELDLDETQITDLPAEIGQLVRLKRLRVSFSGLASKKRLQSNIVIHPGTISNLSQLIEFSIDVDPADKRWDDSVEVVVKEACKLKVLTSLSLYLPKVELLDEFCSSGSKLLMNPSLLQFRFVVGYQKRRIISRVPHEVEADFRNWEKCLKFVNGENIPIEIKGVLNYSNSFFLDNHATAMNLSEFGLENMKRLKYCLLAECNKMDTLIDGEMHYKRNEDDQSESVEPVLESLEYLSIYYMDKLRSLWKGANHYGCMSKLKFLALHMCPQLDIVLTHTLLENFVNLEEIILEDCPQVTCLVSQASDKPVISDKIFLPSLKRVLLLYLPELVSISNGLSIAPKLESIGFYNCPKLKSISKMELSSKSLKIIKGEIKWWQNLNWNEKDWGNLPDYLMHIFSAINSEKDVLSQLREDSDLLEATVKNEDQQLGIMRTLEVEKKFLTECEEICKSIELPCPIPESPKEANHVASDSNTQVSNALDQTDAYKLAVSSKGRQLSGLLVEQSLGKDSSILGEDLKVSLSQLSAARAVEQPMNDASPRIVISPRISLNSDELKALDSSAFNGIQILQKRISLERNESGLSIKEGSIVSEIEGESVTDWLKRQVEHDRKLLSALYKELEEERNASTVAAMQAMAMITRLVEEKATLQMEALQNLRMMEEQAENDMEAMQKMEDLLAEKEKEIQDLRVELEFYRTEYPNESMQEDIAMTTYGLKSRQGTMDRSEVKAWKKGQASTQRQPFSVKPNICNTTRDEETDKSFRRHKQGQHGESIVRK